MKYLSHLIISLAFIHIFSTTAAAQWDVQSDTWDATDGLGRALPTAEETGPPREEKQKHLSLINKNAFTTPWL